MPFRLAGAHRKQQLYPQISSKKHGHLDIFLEENARDIVAYFLFFFNSTVTITQLYQPTLLQKAASWS